MPGDGFRVQQTADGGRLTADGKRQTADDSPSSAVALLRRMERHTAYGPRTIAGSSKVTVHHPPFAVSRPPSAARRVPSAAPHHAASGFTLIEVIAALIILSVLAAMIIPASRYGMLGQSAGGVGECRELFELQGEMEEIVAVYKNGLSEGDGDIDLEEFRNTVLNNYDYVDVAGTQFLEESGNNLELEETPASQTLLLVTLVNGDQRIASIFSGK